MRRQTQRFMVEPGCNQSAADDVTTTAFLQREKVAATANWQGEVLPPGGFHLMALTREKLLISIYGHARLEN